jgi:HD-like signal output (HDOD) protein
MEADYIAGLLHNLGIIIQAITFPDEIEQIHSKTYEDLNELIATEEDIIGWNHAKTGAYYLWNHHISEDIVEAVNFHNEPEKSTIDPKLCSAVYLANILAHQLGLKGIEKIKDEKDRNIARTTAWSVLFPKETEEQHNENKLLIEASMNRLKEISTHIL